LAAMQTMPKKKIPYIDRDISWLSFNERVLQEALDPKVPLVERVRFMGIFSNNMDEFYKVRVASLRRLKALGDKPSTPIESKPSEVLKKINKIALAQQSKFDEAFRSIIIELRENGIGMVKPEDLTPSQTRVVKDYFNSTIRPLLVPIMLQGKSDFPPLEDSEIYFAVKLSLSTKKCLYALMRIPPVIPRVLQLPGENGHSCFIFIDDIIRFRLHKVFSIFPVESTEAFTIKVSRDAELELDDDVSKSLVEKMAQSVKNRKEGDYVRLVYDRRMPQDLLRFLLSRIGISDKENVIPGAIYHNKKDLMRFPDFGKKELCFKPMPPLSHPRVSGHGSIMKVIDEGDVMVHYPYQKFNYTVDLLREAAIDPKVRAIRINLYRVGKDSHIVNALINAVMNGKLVVVVIELGARFDESNNIKWANELQEAGAKVIFGVPGLKVHSKLLLISRKSGTKTTRYAHIGTGNFHEGTAKVYGDISIFTSNPEVTNEVRRLFKILENNFERTVFRHLAVSPFNMRRKFTDLINAEIRNAKKGKPAWIKIKLNNLTDVGMIKKLYEASQAGVRVDMVVRSVCSLVAGAKGYSENIHAVSIVGRFLEHARIIAFCNAGKPLYYIGSADWMARNLDHRIEVCLPVTDTVLRTELEDFLGKQFRGNVKARLLTGMQTNEYVPMEEGQTPFNAQEETYLSFLDKTKKTN
jgi:polyphosphate kinase